MLNAAAFYSYAAALGEDNPQNIPIIKELQAGYMPKISARWLPERSLGLLKTDRQQSCQATLPKPAQKPAIAENGHNVT